jgi:hypothetical protein
MSKRTSNPGIASSLNRLPLHAERNLLRLTRKQLWLVGISALLLSPCLAAEDDPRIAISRDYASQLQDALSGKLKAAMQQGGPVSAIEVCQIEAPLIAAELSSTGSPSRVGRTALKVRNRDNAPDLEELQVLLDFTKTLEAGDQPPLSEFISYPDGSARYMQTIITQSPCLACHGEVLANDVKAAIAERYPEDQATGFKAGDLRGAFVIDWPATSH